MRRVQASEAIRCRAEVSDVEDLLMSRSRHVDEFDSGAQTCCVLHEFDCWLIKFGTKSQRGCEAGA